MAGTAAVGARRGFAGFDTSVLQFKAGLLLDTATCDEALSRLGRRGATVSRAAGAMSG